jgi:phosphatidylglycerol---prolipoprotein diacylglyceryl transferase
MMPLLYEGDTWNLRSYDVILWLAIIVCCAMIWSARSAFRAGKIEWLVFLGGNIVFALVGARINGWLFFFGDHPEMLAGHLTKARSGMTAFGGIAGVILFSGCFAVMRRWSFARLIDIVVPVLALGEAIQRWGCFLHGCCYGRETETFPGMMLPDSIGIWRMRYPVQIITSIYCAVLFVWLWKQRKSEQQDGVLALQFLLFYSLGRLILDFMRGDQPMGFGFLSSHQTVSIVIAMVASVVLYLVRNGSFGSLRSKYIG